MASFIGESFGKQNPSFYFHDFSISLDASMPYPGLFLSLGCCSAKTIVFCFMQLLGLGFLPLIPLLKGTGRLDSMVPFTDHTISQHTRTLGLVTM